jgi:hypothetical protein
MLELKNIAWYAVVTLRDTCIGWHLERLRKFYPDIAVFVIDNNIGKFDIQPICKDYNVTILKNDSIKSITQNHNFWGGKLLEQFNALAFSSDDIYIFEGGFLEKSLDLINNHNKQIVSFGTDRDPVAYLYTKQYYDEVSFNNSLNGKESSLDDLLNRTKAKYNEFPSIGEYWTDHHDLTNFNSKFWRSRYVGNPHEGQMGKDDVNRKLRDLGLPY